MLGALADAIGMWGGLLLSAVIVATGGLAPKALAASRFPGQ